MDSALVVSTFQYLAMGPIVDKRVVLSIRSKCHIETRVTDRFEINTGSPTLKRGDITFAENCADGGNITVMLSIKPRE